MLFQLFRLSLCLTLVLLISQVAANENPSNPLSKVKNTDIRTQYFDLGDGKERTDHFIQGAFMAAEKIKIRYEAHYWDTNITGHTERDWESIRLRGIYFPKESKWGNTPYRTALGLEWVKSFSSGPRGIGTDADLLSPFIGVAIKVRENLVLTPMLQHFAEYSGEDQDITAARLVGIWKLSANSWSKLETRISYDWDKDRVPATAEIQFGHMLTPKFGIYLDASSGVGKDRVYNWGAGLGLRFDY